MLLDVQLMQQLTCNAQLVLHNLQRCDSSKEDAVISEHEISFKVKDTIIVVFCIFPF